jgi:protein-tyrosine phosphatase
LGKKTLLWSCFALCLLGIGVVQFIPAPPLVIPAELPKEQRADHRLLNFEGIANFRDLGGYATDDGRQVKWGVLYRSGTLAHSSAADLDGLAQLGLQTMIDFRSAAEKEEEPDRLPDPPGFDVVAIPTLDDGNKMVAEIMQRIDSGDFGDMEPGRMMLDANRQFASSFTPQYREFARIVQDARGAPVLWHCSAGKDRAGFAAAVLLRILGVPEEIVVQDYMASKEHALEARRTQLLLLRLFKGQEAADKMAVLMGVEEAWIRAGLEEIDASWGSFDNYVREGLGLSNEDVEQLKSQLLVSPAENIKTPG